MVRILLFGVVLLFFMSCGPSESRKDQNRILTEINISYQDSLVQKIIGHQDRLESDSLIQYFQHPDPTFRFIAARAFASTKNKEYIEELAKLLHDPIDRVAQAAAYSLGQIGDSTAETFLLAAFDNVVDSTETVNHLLNATILEAIGKCGSESNLVFISQVSTYKISDHFLLLGQARSIYRYMLRGIIHDAGTDKMIGLLADPEMLSEVRMLAANYLSRAELDLSRHRDILSLIYSSELHPDIKMFLPLALIKTDDKTTIDQMKQSLRDGDFRIKCNATRALGSYDFASYRNDIQRMLQDKNVHVATTAAETILQYSPARYWKTYMTLSLGTYPWQVKIRLLHAVSKLIPYGNEMFSKINQDLLRQRIQQAQSPYEKGAAIKAISEYAGNYSLVIRELDNADHVVISTSCMEALVGLVQSNKFKRLQQKSRQTVIDRIIQGMQAGDVAMVQIGSAIFGDTDIDLSNYGVDPSVLLNEVADKLDLPRDVEAYKAVRNAEAVLKGETYNHLDDLVYTHSIEWPLVQSLGDTVRASIQTTKGPVELALYRSMAPATVTNFVDLANLNYYAGKNVHRVVPGFVIQGGCNRGDGFGSMDYNIRTELTQQYFNKPGYIGMASAGNHTESAQWFITQSATPHLDENFTIFGEVVYGMDIVNQIEVGDVIENISIR